MDGFAIYYNAPHTTSDEEPLQRDIEPEFLLPLMLELATNICIVAAMKDEAENTGHNVNNRYTAADNDGVIVAELNVTYQPSGEYTFTFQAHPGYTTHIDDIHNRVHQYIDGISDFAEQLFTALTSEEKPDDIGTTIPLDHIRLSYN